MRVSIAIFLGLCACADANPLPIKVPPGDYDVCIASEHLVVNVSPTNASLTGTFTFALPKVPGTKPPNTTGGLLDVPIWLPATGLDKEVDGLLQSATKHHGSSDRTERLKKALALHFRIPGETEQVGSAYLDGTSFIAKQAAYAGFRTLVFRFKFEPKILAGETPPVTISYRQPSLRCGTAGQFYYTIRVRP
jgi:hypothetical protein